MGSKKTFSFKYMMTFRSTVMSEFRMELVHHNTYQGRGEPLLIPMKLMEKKTSSSNQILTFYLLESRNDSQAIKVYMT